MLGKENSDEDYYKREKATVVGFGPSDDSSTTMQQISQRIRPFKYCERKINSNKKLKKYLPDGFNNTLLCTQNR